MAQQRVDKCLRLAWLDTSPAGLSPSQYTRGQKSSQVGNPRTFACRGWRVQTDFIDASPFPLNPLRRQHTLYAGFDPVRALRLLLSRENYDGVIAVGESSALVYLWSRDLTGIGGPVVLYDPPLDYGWRARRWVLDQVLSRCDGVLVRGSNQKRFLQRRYGKRCRVEVVYHAIDTDFWAPQENTLGDYVFSIGDDPGRDFQTLLRAVKGLPVKVVVKTGSHRLPESASLPYVKIIRERVSFDELKKLYGGARLVVLPLKDTIHAGGVNSLLEAMAMGKPILVSRSQGITDYYIRGQTAVDFSPGDWEGLHRAILDLWDDENRLRDLGSSARRYALERFSRPVFNQGFYSALLRIFAGEKEHKF
ncbi:Glycosyltransferase involved in cell wall bisynthesis [Desulfacinum hydrothermale DSM 13146]|uniref:Glycosyltransferase involved in cell wall bisynthesis n=2 Tax=Desulfacinum hydrothermale TaxID=109258 RepID=A0A1W1XR27_9BACT|nr:glycosyltransferase family 4 protein [Desulfacinum hydrothermale]SMC26305.1 Glycosyltransferase involved in cell wall bisynthesis [Desulfacinum hydrothermale DSM 13146]